MPLFPVPFQGRSFKPTFVICAFLGSANTLALTAIELEVKISPKNKIGTRSNSQSRAGRGAGRGPHAALPRRIRGLPKVNKGSLRSHRAPCAATRPRRRRGSPPRARPGKRSPGADWVSRLRADRWTPRGSIETRLARGERRADLRLLPPPPRKTRVTHRPPHPDTQLLRGSARSVRGRRGQRVRAWLQPARAGPGRAAALTGDGPRAPEAGPRRAAGSGSPPRPHLAALLVMKADHHDVQHRPPGGALAAPPGLLHRQPPWARTTATSTAEGGGPGDPAVPQEDGDRPNSGVNQGAA